jgi:3-phenylpropionate/trans-cinnamate dioxygenase ferredoxin reductase component
VRATHHRVTIVGGGHGGFELAAALRHVGFSDRIRLLEAQGGLPYQRPPLSKDFLAGKAALDSLPFGSSELYERLQVELLAGERAISLDRAGHRIELASGGWVDYDHLILATGASVRRLPNADLDGILVLRTLSDAALLAGRLYSCTSLVVVGGGFIGLELASVAAMLGVPVTVIESLPRLMSRLVSPGLSSFYLDEHTRHGVEVRTGSALAGFMRGRGGSVAGVTTQDGQRFLADLVVVAVGVAPNTQLAADAGLAVEDGIVVDPYLCTADRRISSIGDCARYPSRFAEKNVRLESVQNAADQARCVASRLVGKPAPYSDVPWFWSDQFDLKLQIAGLTAGHDDTVTLGDPTGRSFSVLCFAQGRLIGSESVNRPGDHMASRRLLSASIPPAMRLRREHLSQPDFDLKAYAKSTVLGPVGRAGPAC